MTANSIFSPDFTGYYGAALRAADEATARMLEALIFEGPLPVADFEAMCFDCGSKDVLDLLARAGVTVTRTTSPRGDSLSLSLGQIPAARLYLAAWGISGGALIEALAHLGEQRGHKPVVREAIDRALAEFGLPPRASGTDWAERVPQAQRLPLYNRVRELLGVQ